MKRKRQKILKRPLRSGKIGDFTFTLRPAQAADLKSGFRSASENERLAKLRAGWPHFPASSPPSVPDLLRSAASLYEERNKTYGDNYKFYGKLLDALFPNGLAIPAGDFDALNRLGIVHMIAAKLQRYCHNPKRYHKDSARDMTVYSTMLDELTPL